MRTLELDVETSSKARERIPELQVTGKSWVAQSHVLLIYICICTTQYLHLNQPDGVKRNWTQRKCALQELREIKLNIAVISERKRKPKGRKDLERHITIYFGVDRNTRVSCGVAAFVDETRKKNIASYMYTNERILTVRLKKKKTALNGHGSTCIWSGRK